MCKLPKNTVLLCPTCKTYSTKRKDVFRNHLSTCEGIKGVFTVACKYCPSKFKTQSGLYKHERKCTQRCQDKQCNDIDHDNVLVTKADLAQIESTQKSILEKTLSTPSMEEIICEIKNVMKEMPPTTIDNRQDNRQFNLNVFLNEKCKDAMNIMDFARSIQLTYANLDKLLDKGYVDGLSDIIGTGLRNLAITERPMHCSDTKRNVLHVKHEGEWQHDEDAVPIALKAVELIRQRHLVLLKSWQNDTPDARKPDSKAFEHYLDIMKRINGNGARLVDDATFKKRTDKIVKRLSKDVKINKLELTL
jgi:hypothetical protein